MRRPFSPRPLAGTESPARGLFIDRWGTLIDSQQSCLQPNSPPWNFVPHAVNALFRAQQSGWRLYLIGNETAVAKGQVEDSQWTLQESDLLSRLSAQGVRTGLALGDRELEVDPQLIARDLADFVCTLLGSRVAAF